jgi:hypothetical protein
MKVTVAKTTLFATKVSKNKIVSLVVEKLLMLPSRIYKEFQKRRLLKQSDYYGIMLANVLYGEQDLCLIRLSGTGSPSS